MSENKTVETGASVHEFLDGIENTSRREDAYALLEKMVASSWQAAGEKYGMM
jgi:hypothetical protein